MDQRLLVGSESGASRLPPSYCGTLRATAPLLHGSSLDCGPREAHEIFLQWYYRIGLYRSYVKGWKISLSHYLNQDLAAVWLDR